MILGLLRAQSRPSFASSSLYVWRTLSPLIKRSLSDECGLMAIVLCRLIRRDKLQLFLSFPRDFYNNDAFVYPARVIET